MLRCAILIAVALVAIQVSLVYSQADLVVPEGFCVDLTPGWYPFPGDCNGFIYCAEDGREAAGRCVDGLHFRPGANPGEGVCTYPTEDDDCGVSETERECGATDFWEERVTQTCNRYVRCVNGVTETRECDSNLHWDSVTQQCRTPALADCPYPICTENYEGDLEHLPHPTDCNLYFICVNMTPIERACGPGFHWDRINQYCTDPDSAGCILTGNPDPGPEPTETPAPEETTTPEPEETTTPDPEA
ncbi:hypothetical protein DMENIID0001_048270 [Sergentomyia squamirostris]